MLKIQDNVCNKVEKKGKKKTYCFVQKNSHILFELLECEYLSRRVDLHENCLVPKLPMLSFVCVSSQHRPRYVFDMNLWFYLIRG